MQEIILSIDPAIHNIGWSILSYKDEKIELVRYGIIDIMKKHKCSKMECRNCAGFFSDIDTYSCLKHKKEFTEKMKKIKDANTTDYAKNIIKDFSYFDIYSFDSIVIENQPCLKNPVIKSIQNFIMMYFLTKENNVKLLNANCKLFGYKSEKANKYVDNKKHCINLAKQFLGDEKMIEIENLIDNKIDDICDSICMGIYYIMNTYKIKK